MTTQHPCCDEDSGHKVVVAVDEDAVVVDDRDYHYTGGCDSHDQAPQSQRLKDDAALANRHELAGSDDAGVAVEDGHNAGVWHEQDDGNDAAAVVGVAGDDVEVDYGDLASAASQRRAEELFSFSEPAYLRRTCLVAICPSLTGCL